MIPLVCIAQRRPHHWNVISGEDTFLTYLLSTWQPGQAKNLASRGVCSAIFLSAFRIGEPFFDFKIFSK